MCIGIPMRVVSADETMALCEGRNSTQRLNLMRVGPQPPGTWVLAFQGSAVRVMSEEEAAQTSSALAALDAVLSGEADIDRFFGDLIGREPELPAFLKGGSK